MDHSRNNYYHKFNVENNDSESKTTKKGSFSEPWPSHNPFDLSFRPQDELTLNGFGDFDDINYNPFEEDMTIMQIQNNLKELGIKEGIQRKDNEMKLNTSVPILNDKLKSEGGYRNKHQKLTNNQESLNTNKEYVKTLFNSKFY